MPGGHFWPRLRCYAWSITPAWPVAAVVAAYVFLLFGNDQIEDALLGASQDWPVLSPAALRFYSYNLMFALAAWFWARLLLQILRQKPFGLPSGFYRNLIHSDVTKLVLWIPRILGAIVLISSAAGVWRMGSHANGTTQAGGIALCLLGILILYLAIVISRRPVSQWISDRTTNSPQISSAFKPNSKRTRFTRQGMNPIAFTVAWIWIGLSVLATVWILADPVGSGRYFGALSIVPLGLAGICSGLSFIILLSGTYHVPIVPILAILAIISGFTADNHRLYPAVVPSSAPTLPAAASLDEAYSTFSRDGQQRKLLIVATAGGGIRAAFWTAYALSRFHDELGDTFDRALFAISGVSGGSYGAVLYRAMTTTGMSPPCSLPASVMTNQISSKGTPPYAPCVSAYLAPDGLGPVLASLLLPDFQQRFIPVSVFPDRARALELAWQDAWRQSAPANHGELLAEPFAGLWKNGPLPILLLNGTSVSTGRRIVTTNLNLTTRDGATDSVFHDIRSFSAVTPMVISATTAITNSARFPYVTPPGTIQAIDGTAVDQVIDGGVFENSGATTALELYEYLMRKPESQRPDIGVLQITSDPDLPDTAENCGRLEQPADVSGLLPDVLSAPSALFASRAARGTAAMDALRARVLARYVDTATAEGAPTTTAQAREKAPYFAIRLARDNAQAYAPLGWKLSKAAIDGIQKAWTNGTDGQNGCNTRDISRLTAWLGPETGGRTATIRPARPPTAIAAETAAPENPRP
jgi:hypothetical protein